MTSVSCFWVLNQLISLTALQTNYTGLCFIAQLISQTIKGRIWTWLRDQKVKLKKQKQEKVKRSAVPLVGCSSCHCRWRVRRGQHRNSKHLMPQRTCSLSATLEHTWKIPQYIIYTRGERRHGSFIYIAHFKHRKSTHKNIKTLLITNTCSASSSPEDGAFPGLSDCVVLLVLRQHLGQAKITDFHPHLALHQNVSSGQVSVDVSLNGKVVHTLKYECKHRKKETVYICTCVETILCIHGVNCYMANILGTNNKNTHIHIQIYKFISF